MSPAKGFRTSAALVFLSSVFASKRAVRLWFVIFALSSVLILGSRGFAQTASGLISGVVQDESGAVVPGANVTVTNVETGITRSVSTDSAGRYRVPGLISDHYEVQAQLSGFQTEVRKGIELTVGSEAVINLALKVGQVAEKTVVTAEAPLVETNTSALSSLVDEDTIHDLPLNGRSFDQFISLQSSMPVNYYRGNQSTTGAANAFSVNGARSQSNLFLIDGQQMMGSGAQNTQPGGVLGKMLGVDAVQEFSIISSNYSAAYGKKAGGVINVVTRSGSNGLHGSAFEFLRNSALDARNFFDDTETVPPFKRSQFGGSIGGPIRKDHTFFFGNFEALRENLSQASVSIVPDNDARQGLLRDARTGQLVNVGVAPAVKPYFVLFPEPNGRNFGNGTQESLSSPAEVNRQDFFLVRVDHKISDKDTIFGRYYFTQAHQDEPLENPVFAQDNGTRDQMATLEAKRVYSTLLNVFRVGFSRARLLNTSHSRIPLNSSLNFLPTADTVGQINFATQSFAGNVTRAGGSSGVNVTSAANQFEYGDQVFLYRGAHSIQFGIGVQRIQHNEATYTQSAPRGNFLFPDLQSFLQGRPSRFTAADPRGGDPHKSWRMNYIAPYFQDDFKVLPGLTLNLGLRYDLMTVPTEASGNRIANFRTHLVNGVTVINSSPTLGSPLYRSHHTLFSPRVGLAWNPKNDGKLAIRAGFGIFNDLVENEFRFYGPNNPPYMGVVQVSNPPFPLGFAGGLGATPTVNADGVDPNLRQPARLQYNLSIQRQITANTLLNVGYVGSHSYHLARLTDFNTRVFQFLADGTKFFPAGGPRINPALGTSRIIEFDGDSSYNSFQMEFVQRLAHGLRYKASYTFAKNLDVGSGPVSAQALGTPPASMDSYDPKRDHGLSTFDVRNSVVLNFTYDFPWNGKTGAAGKVLGGWQLGTIATIRDGQPFSGSTGFNQSRDSAYNTTDRPNLKPGANNNPVLGGADHYFDSGAFAVQAPGTYGNLGRNTIIGPGLFNMDVSLVKLTNVNERLKVDFRAEFFNLLNRANFGLPNTEIFATNGTPLQSAGRITATTTTSRQLQFALKLIF